MAKGNPNAVTNMAGIRQHQTADEQMQTEALGKAWATDARADVFEGKTVQSNVYPWTPQTLNLAANQWISAHRAEFRNATSFFDEAMERDLAPLRHDFKEAILYLEPKIAAKRASGDEQEVDRLQGYLDNIREASSKLETKFGGGTPGPAHVDEMMDALPPDQGVATEQVATEKPGLEDPELATRPQGTLEGEDLPMSMGFAPPVPGWATPGRPNNNTVRLKNLGGLSGGTWGDKDPQGTSVDSFDTVQEGTSALIKNQSSHIERTGKRTLVDGSQEYSLTGGVKTAADMLRVHAPAWQWVKQDNGMFKRVWENDTVAYIESYTRTAKALGTWNDGKAPTDGDAFLVMALVISSKESGYAVPFSPKEMIEGMGLATKAKPVAGERGGAFLKEWAKTAADHWSFERLENRNVLIIRYDDDGNELGRVEMNASGAPKYTDPAGSGLPNAPISDFSHEGHPHPTQDPQFGRPVKTKPKELDPSIRRGRGNRARAPVNVEHEQGPPERAR